MLCLPQNSVFGDQDRNGRASNRCRLIQPILKQLKEALSRRAIAVAEAFQWGRPNQLRKFLRVNCLYR